MKKFKNLDLALKLLNTDKVGADLFSPYKVGADLFSPYYFLVFPTNLLTGGHCTVLFLLPVTCKLIVHEITTRYQ